MWARTKTGAASMMQLPPSPEFASMDPLGLPNPMSLSNGTMEPRSRIRSVARYGSFRPSVLACSVPVENLYQEEDSAEVFSRRPVKTPAKETSSLGAVAGSHGVVLFRTSRPHSPVLVLSYASTTFSQAGVVPSLAFEPNPSNSLLLALACGNGVLVWDASGHSVSPLLGRLPSESISMNSTESMIRSLSWKSSAPQAVLATATAKSAFLWDLRSSIGTRTPRPSLRFGETSTTAPLLQVACSRDYECCTLDVSGNISIFDIRVAGRSRRSTALSTFESFHYAGAGVSHLAASNGDTMWVSWGLDFPQADAVVKVWTLRNGTNEEAQTTESQIQPSVKGSVDRPRKEPQDAGCHQVAQFSTPNLACARICPRPFEDSLVTVGLTPATDKSESTWSAELWKISLGDSDAPVSTSGASFGAEKMVSFRGDKINEWLRPNGDEPSKTGDLRATELALTYSSVSQDAHSPAGDSPELVLCCLSDNGFVTTNAVISAPRTKNSKQQTNFRSFEGANSTEAVMDGRHRDGTALVVNQRSLDESRHENFAEDKSEPSSPMKSKDSILSVEKGDSLQVPPRGAEGGFMQFDMDVGAYGAPVGILDSLTRTPQSDPVDVGSLGATMGDNITPSYRAKTERIPCPRLCGASFSNGINNIVCFHNGEVQKMWSWYQQSGAERKTSGGTPVGAKPVAKEEPRKSPRTLKELLNMTKAAKESQWGREVEVEDSQEDGNDSSIDDLFDDDTSDDGDSLDFDAGMDGFKDEYAAGESQHVDNMYEKYFGGMRRPVAVPPTSAKDTASYGGLSINPDRAFKCDASALHPFEGPSSDLLAPIVLLTQVQSRLLFNGQSVMLANELVLGDWNAVDAAVPLAVGSKTASDTGYSRGVLVAGGGKNRTANAQQTRTVISISSPGESRNTRPLKASIVQVNSDPMLNLLSPPTPPLAFGVIDDDATVRGGEGGVRSSRQDSMVFLRRLFSHQQQAGSSYHGLISPPDGPLLPNGLSRAKEMRRSNSSHAILQKFMSETPSKAIQAQSLPKAVKSASKVGVFTLGNASTKSGQRSGYLATKKLCDHNRMICEKLGEVEKAQTWHTLSEILNNFIEEEQDTLGALVGGGVGAFGRNLVSSILRYYETQGDVQMVSTIVCVLGAPQRKSSGKVEASPFLPSDQDAKFDLYIKRYADILYSWGLLTKRAELNKHRVNRVPCSPVELESNPSNGKNPRIHFDFQCLQCDGKGTLTSNNTCSSCGSYAFRCSICDNAIRGVFTACQLCGHGGHLSHMMEWFEVHSMCPTGCGCICVPGIQNRGGDDHNEDGVLKNFLTLNVG